MIFLGEGRKQETRNKMRWIGGFLAILVSVIAILVVVAGPADSRDIVSEVIFRVRTFLQTYEEASYTIGTLVSAFFGTYEQVPYTVVKTTNQYEERSYPAQKWVCTEKTAHVNEDVTATQFWKLSGYMTGNNEISQTIEMTVPVSIQFTPASSGDVAAHRMCFYIGQDHQASPAQPSDPSLFIEERPAMNVFTRTVGGYLDTDDNSLWMAEAETVRGFLDSTGESYGTDTMWWIPYDAPWKFWNRRNEVWFKKN